MRAGWIVFALVSACSKSDPGAPPPRPAGGEGATAPAVRSVDDLVAATAAYAKTAELPRLGDAGFLDPPGEQELEWLNDRQLPLDRRMEHGMSLFDDSKAIMRRYGERDLAAAGASPERASDGPESLRWAESVVRQFGRISSALVDELMPTLSPSDPSYAVRMDGLDKMRVGSAGMLQGGLITFKAGEAPLAERRRLAAAWRLHVPRFAKFWKPQQCTQLVAWIDEVVAGERDEPLRNDLRAVTGVLGRCGG